LQTILPVGIARIRRSRSRNKDGRNAVSAIGENFPEAAVSVRMPPGDSDMKKRPMHRLALAATCVLAAMGCRAQTADGVRAVESRDAQRHIEEVGPQGIVDGCGVPVGTHRAYDASGRLLRATTFQYTAGREGCHDLVSRQTVTDYFADGKRKSVRHYQGCYECEPVPVGEWIWYDETGKSIRRETRGGSRETDAAGSLRP
jgi:hypothetical protein